MTSISLPALLLPLKLLKCLPEEHQWQAQPTDRRSYSNLGLVAEATSISAVADERPAEATTFREATTPQTGA